MVPLSRKRVVSVVPNNPTVTSTGHAAWFQVMALDGLRAAGESALGWDCGMFTVGAGTYSTADALATAVGAATLGAGFRLSFFMSVVAVVVGSDAPPTPSQTITVLGVNHADDSTSEILAGDPQEAVGQQVLEVGRRLPGIAGRSEY